MVMRNTHPIVTRTNNRKKSAGKFGRSFLSTVMIAASLLFGAIGGSHPASAQQICGGHDDVLKKLKKSHSERPQALGLTTDGKLIEVLVSSTGSWTILVTLPNRLTCLVATGENWENIKTVGIGSPT